jgi:hypothetical protein
LRKDQEILPKGNNLMVVDGIVSKGFKKGQQKILHRTRTVNDEEESGVLNYRGQGPLHMYYDVTLTLPAVHFSRNIKNV